MRLPQTDLATRLVLFFGGLALIVGLPGTFLLGELAANAATRDRGLALHEQAVALSIVVADGLHERQRDLELLADSAILRQFPLDDPAVQSLLLSLEDTLPSQSVVLVADTQGKIRASNEASLEGTQVVEDNWFQQGMQGDYIGKPHQHTLGEAAFAPQSWLIDLAAPITGNDGRPRGVLSLHLDWEWMGSLLRQVSAEDPHNLGMEAFLLGAQDELLYPADWPHGSFPAQLRSSDRLFAIGRWEDLTRYLVAEQPVQKYASLLPLGWKVVAREPTQSALKPVVELQRSLLLTGLALIGLIGLGTLGLAAGFSRPVRQLVQLARQVEAGVDEIPPAPNSQVEEVNELSRALRSMTATLLQRKAELAEINALLEHKVNERTQQLAELNQTLHQQALHDPLTGLYNRRAARERLATEWQQLLQTGQLYTVIVSDVDFFKRINDQHGHDVGDQVLVEVAHNLKSVLRPGDFLARYGGEEFFLILPNTPLDQAILVAERLRQQVSQTQVEGVDQVTLSLGVAQATPDQPHPQFAVRMADQRLYQAKSRGRNQVVGG